MPPISNDDAFKQSLLQLEPVQQRLVAASFVDHVLPLCSDDRIGRALKVASDPDASDDELAGALKSARAAALDMHTRCGSEGNWRDQAGYFVCRAAVAALTQGAQAKGGSPAWQAAMSSRMARTSVLIGEESDAVTTKSESEWQYRALEDYTNA
jgi:hypothetical protein